MAGDVGTATGAVFYAWHAAEIEKQRNSVGPTAAGDMRGSCGGHVEDIEGHAADRHAENRHAEDIEGHAADMRRT